MILQRRERARGQAALRHGRHERGAAEANGDHDPRLCIHVWRPRAVTAALADCECEVCDLCGATHFADTHGVGAHSPVQGGYRSTLGGVGGLETLARRWSAGGAASAAD